MGQEDQNAAHLRLLSRYLAAVLWTTDAGLRITSLQGRSLEQLKVRSEDWVGRELAQVPGVAAALEAHRRALAGEPGSFMFEWNERSFQAYVEPVRDAGGAVVGCAAVAMDITEHRQAERALRDSEALYHDLVETLPQNIFRKDRDGHVTFGNQRYCQVLGKSLAELLGKTDYDLFPRELAEKYRKDDRHVMETGEILDVEEENRPPGQDTMYVRVVKTPVRDSQGNVIGVQGIFWDVTEQKLAKEQLTHRAFYDQLTNLPNRTLFLDRLRQALRRSTRGTQHSFAVLFLDLDHFKSINDSLGHLIGDQLLVEVARRLESGVRPGDTVARLGGDEFTILLEEARDPDAAAHVCERLQAELRKPFTLAGHEIVSTASIGIAFSSPDYDNPEDLLRDADIAMYHAKERGRAGHVLFKKEMHAEAVAVLRLEAELRKAVERREFRVYYQPIIALLTGRPVGFETFVRWQHPERGRLMPQDFLPMADETGLMNAIGSWILRDVCDRLRLWKQQNPAAAGMTVSINVTNKQFWYPDLPGEVARVLKETGVEGARLAFEVSETALTGNTEASAAAVSKLRALGVRTYLDGVFGTAYSSLSQVQHLAIDRLKIDRSFIGKLPEGGVHAEIVETIIRLAHQLGIQIVATGVETAAQRDRLRELHCEFAQGHFFAQPMEGETAARWMELALSS
jgi:diguanylate cyclase (GGDEF)-like protein/PAS domain S-box-containing protein